MRQKGFRHWICGAALFGATLVLADASPAHAVIVEGRFTLYGPVEIAGPLNPAPLQLPPLSSEPAFGGFSYDTERVTRRNGSSYQFMEPGAASLFVTLNGYTYSTTSRPDNIIDIGVGATFYIAPMALYGDSSNPLPALPRLSFAYSSPPGAFSAPWDLPTTSFSTSWWNDPDVYLYTEPQRHDLEWFKIRWHAVGDVVITTVPEPRAALLLPVIAVAALALRRRGRRCAQAAC
jgi:hypothetical protein